MVISVYQNELVDNAGLHIGPNAAAKLKEKFYNPQRIADNPETEIDLTGNPVISELPGFTDQQVDNWITAARILYASSLGPRPQERGKTGRPRADLAQARFYEEDDFGGDLTMPDQLSDLEIGQWALELMGAYNYQPEKWIDYISNVGNMDETQQLAFYELLSGYDRLPDFTWKGTERFLKYTFSSPTTYAGLGAAGLLVRKAFKATGKAGVKNWIKDKIGPAAALAIEGGTYTGWDNLNRQRAQIAAAESNPEVAAATGMKTEINPTELAGATALGTVAAPALGAALPLAGKALVKGAQAAAGAVGRMAEPGVLRSGIGPTGPTDPPSVIPRDEPLGRGVPFNKEITDKNLRLHRKRLDDTAQKGKPYPGRPKNPRRVIPAPEGSGLPDFVIGDIRPEDWLARTEKLMSPGEIKKAANWYDTVFGEFLSRTGNDEEKARRLAGAWLAAQQNESPANAMSNVLFMWEQISRGVPIADVKGKGLPSANKAALAVLSGKDIEGGVGQKIADFIDSAEKRDVRAIMGNDPAGGQPFVVDVHTGRDTGLVDQTLVNYLKVLGYDVPDDVIVDLSGGGIKGPQYENRAMFGRELTDYLNGISWQGRSDWKPREIQAIGWMGLTRMYGDTGVGGDSASAFGRNVRRISMEAAPGEGSPAAIKYGSRFDALDATVQNDVTYKLTQKAIDKVNDRLGINVGNIVHATGGWEKYTNPSTVQQAIASRETAQAAANQLGYLLQQTEVWVNTAKPLTKNPKGFAIDLIEDGSTTIKDNDGLAKLWQMAMDADNAGVIKGYQPIEDAAGNVGIRILVDRGGKKARAGIDAWVEKFSGTAGDLPYNIKIELSEAEIYKARNNWKDKPDGNNYLSRDQKAGGDAPAQSRSDFNTDRQELEDYFGSLIDKAGAK